MQKHRINKHLRHHPTDKPGTMCPPTQQPSMRRTIAAGASALILTFAVGQAYAGSGVHESSPVPEWNAVAEEILMESGMGPAGAYRAAAIVQTAVLEGAEAVEERYPVDDGEDERSSGAAVAAATAAANRVALSELAPSEEAAVEQAYRAALADLDGDGLEDGVAAGEAAAAAILEQRAGDGFDAPEAYRPATEPGVYVPTPLPAGPQWADRTPCLMETGDAFRPGPPPDLASEAWARDLAEVKALGSTESEERTDDQSEIAEFWETTQPPVYLALLRSAVDGSGHDSVEKARLFAAATQAMDDALIAVMDAKYHHAFWRPITAIRNADRDGNDDTERDAGWTSFIVAPMHPEYPCAHCILAGAVGAVLAADAGEQGLDQLVASSRSGDGERTFGPIEALTQEVELARIVGGIHFRTSSEVGTDMGRRIGLVAAEHHDLGP
jgi:hypothetical protein